MRVRNRYRRTISRLLGRRLVKLEPQSPLISFTFDDFPHSAASIGAAILEQNGIRATYYVSLGLVDHDLPAGKAFSLDDLMRVADMGHELGCHTFDHRHSWETRPALFEASMAENRKALKEIIPSAEFETHSYPIASPRPGTKMRAAKYFACCRGGGETYNAGITDANDLKASFLEKSRGELEPIRELIEQNNRANGWLIFATHDVAENPSPFGCTPDFFSEVVRLARSSGATILPVAAAWRAIPKVKVK